jgi:acetate kinase
LIRTSGLDTEQLGAALTQHAGLAGLAGLAGGSGDMREVLANRATGDPEATTAVRTYLHRLRREIAAAASSLECLDALVLTGGVAEHSAWLRAELATSLGLLDIQLDHELNDKAAHDALLSHPGAPVAVLLIHAREDVELARGTAAVVRGQPGHIT